MHAYKDDEKFAQAILDLAEFVVEYRAHKRRLMPAADPSDTATGVQRRTWLRATEQRDEQLKKILHQYHRERPENCPLCGGPVGGSAMCPHCGNLAF